MRKFRLHDFVLTAPLQKSGKISVWSAGLLSCVLGFPAHAQSSADESIEYLVVKGDTLLGIGHRLLENPADWRRIAELRYSNKQTRLPIGLKLIIPKELLKSKPGKASVSLVSGGAQVNGQGAQVGQQVDEAALLSTAADGILEIKLGDGSTLKLTPGSRLRLERLRQYHREDVIEARTSLEQGRVEVQASPQRRKPLEIRTPFATAAVRGTQFRVGSGNEVVTSEVLEGAVSWGAASGSGIALESGFGSAGTRNGVLPAERLLPAPELAGLPRQIQVVALSAPFPAVPQASAYRVQVSDDPGFSSVLQERVINDPRVEYLSIRDGTLFLRVRPIARSRVEGFDRLTQVEVRARPFAPNPRPAPNTGILFAPQAALSWDAAEQAGAYQLQLSTDSGFSQILSELTVGSTAVELPLLTGEQSRAIRYWRVAGVNKAGGYLGPYSAAQALRFYAPPAAPTLLRSEVERALLGWTKRDAERYTLEIADNAAFSEARRFDTSANRLQIDQLKSGLYFARLTAITDDGVTLPQSPVAEFRVKSGPSSGFGLPLESGTGIRIESP